MITKKLKAYTLFELTVAMLITALIVALAFTIYTIVTRSFQTYDKKNRVIAAALMLDHVLKRDFNKADTILRDSAGVLMLGKNQPVRYDFYPDHIIRYSIKPDTFNISIDSVATRFESVPVYDLTSGIEHNRIDQLDFLIKLEDKIIPYHYAKLYSSTDLIQRIPNAIN